MVYVLLYDSFLLVQFKGCWWLLLLTMPVIGYALQCPCQKYLATSLRSEIVQVTEVTLSIFVASVRIQILLQ